jgi:hypothetical protein
VLRIEEHRPGQGGLEQAVAELAGQPNAEQSTESGLAQNEAQVMAAPHSRWLLVATPVRHGTDASRR